MTKTSRTALLRIFPLAQVVLYPDGVVPLYIFEPRYRAMTKDALADDRLIGMVAVLPQHADAMSGDPPIFEVRCAGRIARAQERSDGTYSIALEATRRFRVVSELPRRQPYRVANVEYLDEAGTRGLRAEIGRRRSEVRDALEHLIAAAPDDRDDATDSTWTRLDTLDDDRFVNVLAQMLDLDVLEKQRLLESDGVANRYDVMVELMRFRLAAMRGATRPDTGLIH
jgi:Lon protease-like protein